MGQDHVYMQITNDKYELPLAVADTVEELAQMRGVKKDSIYSIMSHFRHGKNNKCQYIKVVFDGE